MLDELTKQMESIGYISTRKALDMIGIPYSNNTDNLTKYKIDFIMKPLGSGERTAKYWNKEQVDKIAKERSVIKLNIEPTNQTELLPGGESNGGKLLHRIIVLENIVNDLVKFKEKF